LTATGNIDLQICNGYYRTKKGISATSGGSNPVGYLDYSNYFYDLNTQNTVNYSTISETTGYRYATFSFKAAQNTAPYTKIQFSINGASTITIPQDATKPTIGSTRLYCYYRIENGDLPASYGLTFPKNTTWFDALDNSTPLSTNNYFNNEIVPSAKGSTTNVYDGNAYTINCDCPSLVVGSTDNIYVYFMICAPMKEQFSFSSVSSKFT
jgi:hypothetical protein